MYVEVGMPVEKFRLADALNTTKIFPCLKNTMMAGSSVVYRVVVLGTCNLMWPEIW